MVLRAVATSVVAMLWAQVAHAQQQPPALCAEADKLLDEGVSLMKLDRAADALTRFKRADELCSKPRTIAEVGLAEAEQGNWLDANKHLGEALAHPSDEWIVSKRAGLDGALAEIKKNLAFVTVLGGTAGTEVLIDGKPAGRLPLRTSPAVLPGRHLVDFRPSDGTKPFQRAIEPARGATARIDLRSTVPIKPQDEISRPFLDSTLHRVGVAGLTAGVLLLAGGGAAHGVYAQKVNHWNYDCVYLAINMTREQNCPGELDAINLMQGLAIAGYAVGGALSIASVVMLALPAKKERATVACGGGPGDLGIACGGMF